MSANVFNLGDILATLIIFLFLISFAYFVSKLIKRKTVGVHNRTSMEQTLKNIERQNEVIIELLKKK